MFVGYEIKAQLNQAKPLLLETDIKLSQAVLDPSKVGKKEPVCLMVEYNKKQFIVAVLDSTRSWQCPLDLMFSAGSEIKFFLRGSGTVHLTGFEYRDDMHSELGFDESSDEEVEDEEEAEDNEAEVAVKGAKVAEKRASKAPVKNAKTNGVSKPALKKAPLGVGKAESDDDDDDSEDEDFDSDMMDQDDDIDMSDDDDEDDDDEEDLDDEDEESEVEED